MGAVFGLIGDVHPSLLEVMGRRLQHRGTSRSDWSSDDVSMGMWSHVSGSTVLSEENIFLVADADIYNAEDLRRRLSTKGIIFSSFQVEEVILKGYKAYGLDICERLRGDFAFALWDRAHERLVLARDALGSRPLFYWKEDEVFAFASEYKALLSLPFVPATVDAEALQVLQHTKFPPANHTLLQGIYSVPAGHLATFQDTNFRTKRYWQPKLDIVDASEEYHAKALREKFLGVVERRVDNAAEIGVTLSGGIDSAAVAAAVKAVKPTVKLHTFTCGYGPMDPEVRAAEVMADLLGTTHHNIFITSDTIPSLLPELVWHLEDPIARTETLLAFETARYASKHVDVVLAGHAADGLYGGMPRHKLIRLIEWFPLLKTPLKEFYDYTQLSILPESLLGRAIHRLYYRGRHALPPTVKGVNAAPSRTPLPPPGPEMLNRLLLESVTDGISKWLPKVDRTHMAHGLRCRSPFTDIDLIATSFQIPDRLKIRGWREKHIFREAVRPLLPEAILTRPKFPQAMEYDLELSRILDRLCDERLNREPAYMGCFFSKTDIDRLRERNADTPFRSEQMMRLWTLLLTEVWAKTYLDSSRQPMYA